MRQRAARLNILPDESGVPVEPCNQAYRRVKVRPSLSGQTQQIRAGTLLVFIRSAGATGAVLIRKELADRRRF
jgi:hypothetical protein